MKLPVTSYGESGSPVVVMHGLFGSSRNWMTAARRLAAEHRVFAFDLRNHGTSPHTDTMSYPEMAEDVYETISSLGVGPVALVGHSMGGKTAMLTALRHAAVVERLVVVDAAPVSYPPAFVEYAQAMRNADLSSVQRRADVDAQLVDAVPTPGTRAFLLQNLILDDQGARWRPNLPVLEAALPAISAWPEDESGRYDGPTLFIYGGKSDYVQHNHRATIERYFPQVQFAEIPEAGHWVHAERLDDFLATLTPFLP
ncbi:pimeloyl-ACP methyl ester carboxylesterase [Kribbella orskensis]|uniref:Pimeloyl-ACP methyl ester carboxylesterase n=1 Tax=Kribbella orskensis TaxID=2512216 RepID=A0ABY2BIA4_9ACTN|nr:MULTISPECIES: alpha/beta fold hydrolase [Kribbella]TCN38236.1 pimeloyl-ACP methyl ester carboxylesterase [Kribbella sp. VKM Ac-2500]TCO20234.1 pimeloyl-ACP methyl ester carboxylesterase [Kribbella orskensis]